MPKTLEQPKIWTEKVRRAWELPQDITVSQWADRNRILDTMTSNESGQWHTDRTPYLQGIMDALNEPLVEEITIMASTQVGKTESLLNLVGYIVDQDPGPTLFVMPREDDAKSISTKRLLPMMLLSPALQAHILPRTDAITQMEITLDRMIIYLSGANSPAGLASRPVRYLLMDETDKYPHFTQKEADPIKLATERTRTYWNRKIIKCSTPTTREGYIAREYEKSDRRRFYVPCPHCGKYQVLIFRTQVKWPDGERDPEAIKSKRLAWYECIECRGQITDAMKHKMVSAGIWAPDGCEVEKNGSITGEIPHTAHRGFWINALYSPWLTFSDIAAEFLSSKESPELLMNFVNSWLAEVWEENLGKTHPEQIKSLALPHERGIVPSGVRALTGGVDVQKDHFFLIIRGWGVGQESWKILSERVELWDDVVRIMFQTHYPSEMPNKPPFPVRLTCIDTGYRTDEVYSICRYWRDMARPIKGQKHLSGVPYKNSAIDKYPDGKPIPGGIQLSHIDTTYFKDKLARFIQNTAQGGSYGWHLHINPSDDYCRQISGEHKVILRDRRTGRATEEWRPITSHAPTHYLDCEVYAAAAAEMLRVFAWREDAAPAVHRPQQSAQTASSGWVGGSNWANGALANRNNWINRNG